MKNRPLLSTLAALALAGGTMLAFAPGCGGVTQEPTGTGGSAGSTTSTTSSSSSGGSGGTATITTNPLCEPLCQHFEDIQCKVLQDCMADCQNHLNAPSGCEDEADAVIDCWVKNLDDLQCTMTTLLPPDACKDVEAAYNTCVNGGGAPDASCICSAGVGVGDDLSNCSRKTTCETVEFVQTCQALAEGEPWTCSCFANGGLLGTCPEPSGSTHCSNEFGCCVSLFCAAAGE